MPPLTLALFFPLKALFDKVFKRPADIVVHPLVGVIAPALPGLVPVQPVLTIVPEEHNDNLCNAKHEDTKDDESDDGSEDDSDDEDFQEKWAPILAIPDDSITKLVNRIMKSDDYELNKRTQGGFHHVAFVSNSKDEKLVVKIPVVGTKSRWQPPHRIILRSEAHTMMYIKNKLPKFPIADVLAFDETLENEIKAPFIIQSFLEGQDAIDLWYDPEEMETAETYYDLNGEVCSEEREAHRITFLRSLSKHMADLRHLEFDGIGMLTLDDENVTKPNIVAQQGWDDRFFEEDRYYWERPVYTSSKKYYMDFLKRKSFRMVHDQGLRSIYEIIFSSSPFAKSMKSNDSVNDPESFVLAHDDLNLQNVLVSPTGEVTGILDWDMAITVPRCMGYATVPIFLQEDWLPAYKVPDNYVHSPWSLRKYRKIYADTMKEACNDNENNKTDARFTLKSALYNRLNFVMFKDNAKFYDNMQELLRKILVEIPHFRHVCAERLQYELADRDWKEVKEVLEEWIPKVLDPENVSC